MTGLLVLVTGTGRSGTSTIAGSLHHLGLSVPGPHLGANPSNPKGFFESRWSVAFHKEITKAAKINDFDSRPAALDRAAAVLTPELRQRLVDFLVEISAGEPQVVVKDPRSVWLQRVWKEAADEAGLDIRYLSMLRHPAEVVGSRTTYYAKRGREGSADTYATFNVARWVNNSLISERETRGEVRSFVPYADLLVDWRATIGRTARELGLTLDTDVTSTEHHAVDDFIDPDLRRHAVTWDGLAVPADLRAVAEEVWADLLVLSEHAGADNEASTRLDALQVRYTQLFTEAVAVSHDAVEEAKEAARREGARKARRNATRREQASASPEASPAPGLDDVSGRELLRATGRRAVRRLRRR